MSDARPIVGRTVVVLALFAATSLQFHVRADEPVVGRRISIPHAAGSVEIVVPSPSPELSFGDLLDVSVIVRGKGKLSVTLARAPVQGPWEVQQTEPATFSQHERESVWVQRLKLAPLGLGSLPLQVSPIKFRDGDDAWRSATVEPTMIEVRTNIADPDPTKIVDVSNIERSPEPKATTAPWGWALAGLIVVVLAIALWSRRQTPNNKASSPANTSARELAWLLRRCPTADDGGRGFMFLFHRLVRRHLKRAFGASARSMTEDELAGSLTEIAGLSDEQRRYLTELSHSARAIKFGGQNASTDECQSWAIRFRELFLGGHLVDSK